MSLEKNNVKTKPTWRRRQLVVNPPVQYVFIYYSLYIGAIFFTAGSAITAMVFKYVIAGQFSAVIFGLMVVLLLLLLGMSIVFGLNLSNRIAGPIFRLLRELQKINNVAEMNEISLRKHDYFQDVAKAYNDVLKQLRERDGEKK
jgi:ABC-type transport system involved in multi-copper enzyme maturation permease subunit